MGIRAFQKKVPEVFEVDADVRLGDVFGVDVDSRRVDVVKDGVEDVPGLVLIHVFEVALDNLDDRIPHERKVDAEVGQEVAQAGLGNKLVAYFGRASQVGQKL